MRPFRHRARLVLGALAGCLVITGASVHAQTYPSRPVRIVVPFPPGNAADVTSRAMSDRLAQRLGQPVVVDNRAGGGGIIGVDAVAKAAPDGYTVLISSISPVAINPSVFKKLPYEPERDLMPVTLVGYTSMILVANTGIPAATLGELIGFLKSQPGKHNYGHLGAGTISQLLMEQLKNVAALDVVGVPYKGSGLALTELLGGQISIMFDGMTSANTQVKAGKVKAFAVSSQKRSPYAPDVPTLGEAGITPMHDLNMVAWVAAFMPAGTPRPIVERWLKEITEVTQLPDVRERLAAVSLEPAPSESPDKFAEYYRSELAKWSRIAKLAGVYQSQ